MKYGDILSSTKKEDFQVGRRSMTRDRYWGSVFESSRPASRILLMVFAVNIWSMRGWPKSPSGSELSWRHRDMPFSMLYLLAAIAQAAGRLSFAVKFRGVC